MRSDAKSIGKGTEKVKEKGKGKQSTLDNFVGIAVKENQTVHVQDNDAESEEESTCTHQVDTEAAKTWIYPGTNNSLVVDFLILFYFGFVWFNGGKCRGGEREDFEIVCVWVDKRRFFIE